MGNEGIVFAGSSKSADAPDIEAGVYDATFDGVRKQFVKGGQYGDGDRFVWAVTLDDPESKGEVYYIDGEPVEVEGLSSLSTNVLSETVPKAVKYLKALMTDAEFALFKAGEGTPAEALIGRKVQVIIKIKANGWPEVADMLPVQKRRATARAAATTEGDE